MDWNSLISSQRFGQNFSPGNKPAPDRTQFQRDYDRIIFSSPFRRLQNKTQVFPLPGSIFVHNRLTHSLEVASVGRSLGSIVVQDLVKRKKLDAENTLLEIPSIVATACLAHDMGNPPFGHSGEKAISRYFQEGEGTSFKNEVSEEEWADFIDFEGNANALRILTHQFRGRVNGGYRLTYSTLASVIKYPCPSAKKKSTTTIHTKKYGYFQSEKNTFNEIIEHLNIPELEGSKDSFIRHPLVYLVEAADDICYTIIDLEDAHRLKILSYDTVRDQLWKLISVNLEKKRQIRIHSTLDELKEDPNEQIAFLRSLAIGTLVKAASNVFLQNEKDILEGKFHQPLFDKLDKQLLEVISDIENLSVNEIYNHTSVAEVELAGYKILGGLLEEFVPAALNRDGFYEKKLLKLVPNQFQPADDNTSYENILSMLDFVSGMTDLYAVDLFKKIKGISLR